jgi:glycerophosphoryl diester phosphodiesterase
VQSALLRSILVLACLFCLACGAVAGSSGAFDAHAEPVPSPRLSRACAVASPVRPHAHRRLIVVAHNAGDHLPFATRAVAAGADVVEIDVRYSEGALVASHDPPLPLLEDVLFHPPSLQQAWDVAQRRGTVLLHLKESSPGYLAAVRDFVRVQAPRRLIVQTDDLSTLRWVRREVPSAQRLWLVLRQDQLDALGADPTLGGALDGVSIRDRLATPRAVACLRAHGLRTFVWTVNDQRRVEQLAGEGADGVITDGLGVMRRPSPGPARLGSAERCVRPRSRVPQMHRSGPVR